MKQFFSNFVASFIDYGVFFQRDFNALENILIKFKNLLLLIKIKIIQFKIFLAFKRKNDKSEMHVKSMLNKY